MGYWVFPLKILSYSTESIGYDTGFMRRGSELLRLGLLQEKLYNFAWKLSIVMPKAQPLCTRAKLNFGDRVLDEAEKMIIICFPDKGWHSRLLPSKTMGPNPEGSGEEFYSNSSRVWLLTRLWCVYSFNPVLGDFLWYEKCWHLSLAGGGWG